MDPETVRVPLAQLRPHPRNPRHGNVTAIADSLRAHGQYRAIVARRETMEVLAGNHTLLGLREIGAPDALVHLVDVDEDEALRILLTDNRTADLGSYDDRQLHDILANLDDLTGTGYDDAALAELTATVTAIDQAATAPAEDPGPQPAPPEPVTQPGDRWTLERHTVVCADSLTPDGLALAYDSITIGCVLTDPPYGINAVHPDGRLRGATRKAPRAGHGAPMRVYREVQGDDQPFDATPIRERFATVREQFWFGADYYRRTLNADDRAGAYIVWDKRATDEHIATGKDVPLDDVMGAAFELCWSAQAHQRRILRHLWAGYFSMEGDAATRIHPTQKPVALLTDILERWAPPGCTVADPFLGSGSTLIACERTGRACVGIEIDPAYCDAIINRWSKATGKEPQRA